MSKMKLLLKGKDLNKHKIIAINKNSLMKTMMNKKITKTQTNLRMIHNHNSINPDEFLVDIYINI